MYSLVNTNFCRTYNPNGRQNALSDIKRLLTSRDTMAQKKACGYLIEVISRYKDNTNERHRMIEYLLDNDIIVFLCEATCNLDFELFKSVLQCLRLIWRSRRFFSEEHAAHSMTAVVRALSHYANSGLKLAVDCCLHYLDDLLNGITTHKTTSPLSHQSAYSASQLLACLNVLPTHLNGNPNGLLSSALVLHALISYQPENLSIKGAMGVALMDVLKKWFVLLTGALNHSMLVDDSLSGMFYVVLCEIGMNVLRLIKLLTKEERSIDFVQSILSDEQEENVLKQCAIDMATSSLQALTDLVGFTKDYQSQISTEEYGVFLKFLLNFLYDNANTATITDFCDILLSKGYIVLLPKAQLVRNDTSVRKASTLVLGEMLKTLADKYLSVDSDTQTDACARHIQMGLTELQYSIEKPQSLGAQLQKGQPYSLLIYVYFYFQSTENPEEASAPLLPHLVEHILRLPASFVPPPYVVKALWLVFAMSTISNGNLQSLDERVYLEKATDRLVAMLHPQPTIYYTHNPAILLWAFTTQRIPNYVRMLVLSQWLKSEDPIPTDLTTEQTVWELLLNILIQTDEKTIAANCMQALQMCFDDGDEEGRQEFSNLVWTMLPSVLSKALIDDCGISTNICYFLDVATALLPNELDQTTCLKTAVLMTAMFSKNDEDAVDIDKLHHYKYMCLKLSLYLLGMANKQNDNRVLLTYTNRPGFLASVLSATNSTDDKVACSALQLLSYIVHYYTRNKYQPKTILQIQTNQVIESLRKDSCNERGASLLQLVYMVLNSGIHAPLTLAYDVDVPNNTSQGNALRALMLRIQLMLCRKDSENQTSAGWKTLSSIFKHAIITKNDTKLVAILTSQPWTHILIQFQLTQNITEEFLTFVHNWLTLLRITIKKNQEEKKVQMCKQSLVIKTLVMMNKSLVVEKDLEDMNCKALVIVKEILDDSGIKT